MKIPASDKSEWDGNPQKTIKGLIKHGKRILTPESVVDFLRIQKNELLGGDE
jgi:hypothetical protein